MGEQGLLLSKWNYANNSYLTGYPDSFNKQALTFTFLDGALELYFQIHDCGRITKENENY